MSERMKTWIVEVNDPETGERKTFSPVRSPTESGADWAARVKFAGPLALPKEYDRLETAVAPLA
jgi:hypothetical protein